MQRFTSERPRRRVMDTIAQPTGSDSFDPVTGLATREMFHRRAESEWQRRARGNGPMSLLRVDLDNFEAYRTQHGVNSANSSLREIAEVIARNCHRRGDFAGHIGEHEFVVLLRETAPKGAEKIARRIVEEVAKLPIESNGSAAGITVSIGVAAVIPRPNRFFESLLRLAEQGVEQAGKNGGNQVISVREDGK